MLYQTPYDPGISGSADQSREQADQEDVNRLKLLTAVPPETTAASCLLIIH